MTVTTETLQSKYERILSLVQIGHRHGAYTQIRCPCAANHKHDDREFSASLGLHDDGISFKCFAGCQTDDFLSRLGLTYNDLFPNGNSPTNIYSYHNADGSYHHDKVKYRDPDTGKKTFRYRTIDDEGHVSWTGVSGLPFGLPELNDAIRNDRMVLYVEGEKDALTGRLLGYTATTMGGASDWKDEYKKHFRNANLVLIPDKDNAGLGLSARMQQSLAEVAKSLRVVILPDGKDLTEWVEAGNRDLSPMINEAPELARGQGLPAPVVTRLPRGYLFAWDNIGVRIRVDRLTDECEGYINVLDKGKSIHVSKINLLAPRSVSELAKKLLATKKFLWDSALSQIAIYVNEQSQAIGTPTDINEAPVTMKIEYLLSPLIPMGMPVTLYTAGGKGKSTIADYISVLVQFGICSGGNLPFLAHQTNVLYLDWEADEQTHRKMVTAIKRGLSFTDTTPIRYLAIEQPLVNVADGIREYISQYEIGLVIVDSQMAATASGTRGLTEAQVASEYYNVLRSFGCSSLTIDHITKAAMDNDAPSGPYGSIVKYNRARSVFELKLPDDEDDADIKRYALVHRKFNLGRRLPPIGIEVTFTNNEDELISVTFEKCDIEGSLSLSKSLSKPRQIYAYLIRNGLAADAQTICTGTGIDYKTVTSLLSKYSGKAQGKNLRPLFVSLPDSKWGAISGISED